MLDITIVRIVFVLVLAACAALLPAGLEPARRALYALAGLLVGGAIIFFEIRLDRISLKRLIGAAAGSVLGIFGAFLMALVLQGRGRRSAVCVRHNPALDDLCAA